MEERPRNAVGREGVGVGSGPSAPHDRGVGAHKQGWRRGDSPRAEDLPPPDGALRRAAPQPRPCRRPSPTPHLTEPAPRVTPAPRPSPYSPSAEGCTKMAGGQ